MDLNSLNKEVIEMVPISNNHLKNTTGGSFTEQTYGGTVIGTADTDLVNGILVKDILTVDDIYTYPKELSGAKVYNTQKILSGGVFAYDQSANGTWIISRFTSTLAGVSKTFLQFMASVVPDTTFPYYLARNYINNTTLVRKGLYSRTGYDVNGAKIVKRTTWETNPSATAGADFGTSTQIPTRSVPGEFFLLTNFVDYSVSTSSNYYDYSPITGK